MTASERVLDAARQRGCTIKPHKTDNARAHIQCPSHPDANPSLSIAPRKDGAGVVLYCHAGCELKAILTGLGLTERDLFDDNEFRDVYRPQADYRYPDGRVVHRKPNKSFPQSGNTKGNALFRADRIADAAVVHVVEGEKDVLAIEAVGGAAVCSAMGAGKAHLADWGPLRGKNAIIIADKDEPGRRHAAQIAQLLRGIAGSVRITEAAVGKDAADHLAADKRLDELVASGGDDEIPLPPEPVDETPPDAGDTDTGGGRRSVAAQLVDMTRSDYQLGITDTDDPFGTSLDRPHIAMMLRGGRTGLRAELARRFFTANNTVASQQALADACTVLEGLAAQEDPRRVYLRVGECNGAVYIDTGDVAGSVITITAGTWEVTQSAPVLFRRTKLTGEMATPVRGGDLSRLWEFVPIDEADQPVLVACLVSTLIQVDVPHPIPALLAEHGSAKSSTTRCLVDLVDPSPVPLRQPPRDLDGWSTAASASWVVALDNLSGRMPSWLSDALCRASTGDGNVKRALYTDSDVSVTAYRRCAIINGVDLIIDRGDLADRLAPIRLPRVTTRRSEDDLAAAWSVARPHIFGGLLDLAASAHRRLPNVTVPSPPRMADFARILAAVDEALGTKGLERYRETSRLVAVDTLDEAFIAELVERRTDVADVTSAELLKEIRPSRPDWKPPRDWPKNARAVTAQLTRNAPALRAQGWVINNDGGHTKDGITRWTITPSEDGPKTGPPDPPNPPAQVNGQKSGGSEHDGFPATDPLFPAGRVKRGSGGEGEFR